jgi:hypothetical protein
LGVVAVRDDDFAFRRVVVVVRVFGVEMTGDFVDLPGLTTGVAIDFFEFDLSWWIGVEVVTYE